MSAIEIQVDNKNLDMVLTHINNLKDGIIKSLKVQEKEDIRNSLQSISKNLKDIKNSNYKTSDARSFLDEL